MRKIINRLSFAQVKAASLVPARLAPPDDTPPINLRRRFHGSVRCFDPQRHRPPLVGGCRERRDRSIVRSPSHPRCVAWFAAALNVQSDVHMAIGPGCGTLPGRFAFGRRFVVVVPLPPPPRRPLMKITVKNRKPRNPLVAAALFRRAGSHRSRADSTRQQARRALQHELVQYTPQHSP